MQQPSPTVDVLVSESGNGEHHPVPLLETSTMNLTFLVSAPVQQNCIEAISMVEMS